MPLNFLPKLTFILAILTCSSPLVSASPSSKAAYRDFFLDASPRQLREEFEKASFPNKPTGFYQGYIKNFSTRYIDRLASGLSKLVWRGMYFEEENSLVLNKLRGLPDVFAILYNDISPLDQRPSLIVDYSETFGPMTGRLDEIRQVGPEILIARSYATLVDGFRLNRYYLLLK